MTQRVAPQQKLLCWHHGVHLLVPLVPGEPDVQLGLTDNHLLARRHHVPWPGGASPQILLCRLNLSTEVDQLERACQEGSGLEGAVLTNGTVEFTDPEGESWLWVG